MFKSFDFVRSLYAIVITSIFIFEYNMRVSGVFALHIHELFFGILRWFGLFGWVVGHLTRQIRFGGLNDLYII